MFISHLRKASELFIHSCFFVKEFGIERKGGLEYVYIIGFIGYCYFIWEERWG